MTCSCAHNHAHVYRFVPDMVEAILEACEEEDGCIHATFEDRGDGSAIPLSMRSGYGGKVESDEEEEGGSEARSFDDGDDGSRAIKLNVRTAMLEAKVAALNALGGVCENCAPAAVAPSLERIVKAAMAETDYLHQNVRAAAVSAAAQAVVAVHNAARVTSRAPFGAGKPVGFQIGAPAPIQ